MSLKNIISLNFFGAYADATLLILRLLTGSFLIWGTWDNVSDKARMTEFVEFMRQFGFAAPDILAPLSVWAQFSAGALIVAGLFTRWAGLLMAFNFIVGFLMVHLADDFRAQFPALILIAVSLHLVAAGAGRYAADRFFD